MCRVLPIDQSEITLFDPIADKARRDRLWKAASKAANEDGPVVKLVSADFRHDSEIGFIPPPIRVVAPVVVPPAPKIPLPSFAEAVEAYRIIVEERDDHVPPAAEIIWGVAKAHGITPDDIKGKRRLHHICIARQHACFALKAERNMSYPEIGRRVGKRDHSTAMWAVSQHGRRLNGEL